MTLNNEGNFWQKISYARIAFLRSSNFTWKVRKSFQSCARRGLVLLQRRPFGPVLGRPFGPFGPMCKVCFVITIAVCKLSCEHLSSKLLFQSVWIWSWKNIGLKSSSEMNVAPWNKNIVFLRLRENLQFVVVKGLTQTQTRSLYQMFRSPKGLQK